MSEQTLKERVKEAMDVATFENGYDMYAQTAEQVALDLLQYCADLEHEPTNAVVMAVQDIFDDASERQHERLMEDGPGKSLLEQQMEAMKFK